MFRFSMSWILWFRQAKSIPSAIGNSSVFIKQVQLCRNSWKIMPDVLICNGLRRDTFFYFWYAEATYVTYSLFLLHFNQSTIYIFNVWVRGSLLSRHELKRTHIFSFYVEVVSVHQGVLNWNRYSCNNLTVIRFRLNSKAKDLLGK